MRCLLVALILAILPVQQAIADSGRLDGEWWNSMTRGDRLLYIIGFADGRHYEFQNWDLVTLVVYPLDTGKELSKEQKKLVATYLAQVKAKAARMMDGDLKGATTTQLVDGLDALYADFRNRRILVKNALAIAFRSIGGSTDEDVQKMLEAMRQGASGDR